jgi:hypothetical protein
MSDLDPKDPTEPTTSTDLDPTTAVPVPTAPLTPGSYAPTGDGPTNPVEQPLEPAVAWATAVPVSPAGPRPPRRARRLRWAAAIAVVAVVLGSSAAVAALITNAATASTVVGYVPAGTLAYAEVRLDLPGDQRRAVGEFLQKFPGFADQAALEGKLDEVLDQLVKDATEDTQTYTRNIKPWFDGELAFALGPLPAASNFTDRNATDPNAALDAFRALALVSIKDPALAKAWFEAALKDAGVTGTPEAYDDTVLTVVHGDGPDYAFAVIDDKVVAIGDVESVRDAVDSNGDSAFADEPGPATAIAAANKDHLGFVYVALRPLVDWSMDFQKRAMDQFGGTAAQAAISTTLLKTLPAWGAYWMRFQSDELVLEATAPKPEISFGAAQNSRSSIVEHVPSSALALSVTNGLGATLEKMLELYSGDPTFKPLIDQLDQALGLVGGRDAALGWIGDTALAVNASDGKPEGGLVVAPTDPDKAKTLFTSLGAFIGLGGASQGITVRTEDYNGTTITIVDVGDVSKLSGIGGGTSSGIPLPSGHLEIAYAVNDQIVVIGTGPAFVKHVLDTTTGTSLARDPQYSHLADQVGPGTGSAFVDITAAREMLEKAMADSEPSSLKDYETDVKPFLTPFDAMFSSGSVDGDLADSIVIVSVK